MTVVFFIILFCIALTILVMISSIKVDIQNFSFSNKTQKKLQYDYTIFLKLKLAKKLTIAKIVITKEKVEQLSKKMHVKEKMQNINFKKLKQGLSVREELKKKFAKLNINIEEFHLNLEFGTEDVIITSVILTVLASLLGLILARYIRCYHKEKYEYKMTPIYQNKNMVKLSLNCIIEVKLVHIISIIYYVIKKRKENRKYERTSNRRSYDYSYEQY